VNRATTVAPLTAPRKVAVRAEVPPLKMVPVETHARRGERERDRPSLGDIQHGAIRTVDFLDAAA
jgi:hypothetical protein